MQFKFKTPFGLAKKLRQVKISSPHYQMNNNKNYSSTFKTCRWLKVQINKIPNMKVLHTVHI